MEKIDVLLATYNGERFLRPLIESILGQSHSDISRIISDDASSDGTRDILREYALKDPRVRLFEQHRNLGFARNFEFLLSRSEAPYIAFADQDDIWAPGKLEIMLSVLKTSGKSLAYTDMRRIDANDKVISESWFKEKSYPKVSGTAIKACAVRHFCAGCSQLFTASVRRKMLPFKTGVFAHDWLSVFCASELMGIIYMPAALTNYRAHEGNVYGTVTDYAGNVIRQSNGNASYSGYLEYRRALIEQNHLRGARMCRSYSALGGGLDASIEYLEKSKRVKRFSPLLHKYFMNMKPAGLGRRMFYELLYLHFPFIHYFVYKNILRKRSAT